MGSQRWREEVDLIDRHADNVAGHLPADQRSVGRVRPCEQQALVRQLRPSHPPGHQVSLCPARTEHLRLTYMLLCGPRRGVSGETREQEIGERSEERGGEE